MSRIWNVFLIAAVLWQVGFPNLLYLMIINAVVGVVFFYNPLWNLKECKRFHRRVKIDTAFT